MTASPPPIPEKFELITGFDGFTIRKKWFSLKVIPLLIFAVVWDAFIFFWYSNSLGQEELNWMTVLFPLGHVAVGIGITYFVIASFFNKTDIKVTEFDLTVRTYPFPWIGNKHLLLEDIQSFKIRERKGNESADTFDVNYISSANREKKLVSRLDKIEQAEYLRDLLSQVLQRK